ncbi:MAG: TetR/AcrR family transcriptional regulator [Burkholderiales bacterium]|uniref:TetR/AcrR family transcriptional regulator n=1 Tax=Inhella sp. TaxID=1921806 RepID=UPI001AC60B5E|nr:TetR/AcrR family transcriptional regulator [Burkholderiales bacterium]
MNARPSFRAQVLQAREDAIVDTVNRLLADKGFEAMTVDLVAAEVGIAKASLYKHFSSKEQLAAAAMVRVLDRAMAFMASPACATEPSPIERLKAVARWTMEVQLAGQMPSLPAQNSTLRTALVADKVYMERLMQLSEQLGEWIEAAQAQGQLHPALPAEVVLYTLFARACDPVLGVLKAGGSYSDEQIVGWCLASCFEGLAAHVPAARAKPAVPRGR